MAGNAAKSSVHRSVGIHALIDLCKEERQQGGKKDSKMKRRAILKSTLLPAAAGFSGTFASPGTHAAERHADIVTDVLVIGGGFAGLTTALTAARSGAKVVLLERRAYTGGDGLLSAGIIASAESIVHKAQNFSGDASLEAYWRQIEAGLTDEPLSKVRDNSPMSPVYAGFMKHDPRVMKRSAEMSPEVPALLASFGIEFLPINPGQPFLLPTKPGSMSTFVKAIGVELNKLGVEVHTGARAVSLETEEDRTPGAPPNAVRVTGATAKIQEKTVRIAADAVVIASGGFIDNKDMMRRYKRVWADVQKGFSAVGEGVPDGHDGDGIRLGRLGGAAVEDMESMPKLFAAPRKGEKSASWLLFDTDTAYLVDKSGKRFCDEHASRYTGCALACLRNQIDGAYVVFDEATFTGSNAARWRYADLLAAGGLVKGETIEAAAQKVGVDPNGLRQTLEAIAADAAAGRDSAFGRKDKLFRALKGPFYISKPSYPVSFKTEGGLEVDPDFRVLRAADDSAIPGLYAAGAVCGSISTRLCDVIASGLIVGPEAAAFAASAKKAG